MENMTKNNLQNRQTEADSIKNSELFLWLNKVQQNCIAEITNPNLILDSILKSKESNTALPLILTLCPAVFNLNFPTQKGQTRELVPIETDNLRVKSIFEEMFGFQIVLKNTTGLNAEFLLIFGDLLEKGSDKMITNSQDINDISQKSIKTLREIITRIDQESNGLFQKIGIKMPKIRSQLGIFQQGGKIDLNREQMINKFETEVLDPHSNLFELWTKHLKLARDDQKFTETSWQGQKSAESIWLRMRFLIAELTTDSIFLPEMMKHLNAKINTEPIFIASSTRQATLKMEADSFNSINPRALIPAFRNIGKWLEPPESSPWIDILRNV